MLIAVNMRAAGAPRLARYMETFDMRWLRFAHGAILAIAIASGSAFGAPRGEVAAMAVERGCTTCHSEAPVRGDAAVPAAPSWPEIAARYRRDAGAAERLAEIVVGGSDERHWRRTAFAGMLPNEKSVSPEDARRLVRWILER